MTSSLTTQTYLHWQAEAGALENAFFSPPGLEMVLSMLLPGLRGERLREVCGFLGISEADITAFLTSQACSLRPNAMGMFRARFKRLHNELLELDHVPAKAPVNEADRKRLLKDIEAENGFGVLWRANRLIGRKA